MGHWRDRINPEADASLIVRAVNNHAQLLAALDALMPLRISHQRDGWAADFNRARAAIKAAKS